MPGRPSPVRVTVVGGDRRHPGLMVHGHLRVLHVTRRQVAGEIERVLVWIAVALARAEWSAR